MLYFSLDISHIASQLSHLSVQLTDSKIIRDQSSQLDYPPPYGLTPMIFTAPAKSKAFDLEGQGGETVISDTQNRLSNTNRVAATILNKVLASEHAAARATASTDCRPQISYITSSGRSLSSIMAYMAWIRFATSTLVGEALLPVSGSHICSRNGYLSGWCPP